MLQKKETFMLNQLSIVNKLVLHTSSRNITLSALIKRNISWKSRKVQFDDACSLVPKTSNQFFASLHTNGD